MQRRKFLAAALLMGALPYVSFANAENKKESAVPVATKTKDGVSSPMRTSFMPTL